MLVAFSYLGGMCGGWNVWGGSANAGAACEVAKWGSGHFDSGDTSVDICLGVLVYVGGPALSEVVGPRPPIPESNCRRISRL